MINLDTLLCLDPETKGWLEHHKHSVFGFPTLVRFSWGTCNSYFKDGVEVLWWALVLMCAIKFHLRSLSGLVLPDSSSFPEVWLWDEPYSMHRIIFLERAVIVILIVSKEELTSLEQRKETISYFSVTEESIITGITVIMAMFCHNLTVSFVYHF